MATRKNRGNSGATRKNRGNGNGNGNVTRGNNGSGSGSMAGGKRKLSPALKKWNEHVMKLYRTMKAKNKNTKLRDAMKAAKKTFRKH